MFPKLLLAPMRMYLRMLAKTFRPSITPSCSTIRLFSSRIRSAESLAMSTAASTEIPTSAAFRAGASLTREVRRLPVAWHLTGDQPIFPVASLANRLAPAITVVQCTDAAPAPEETGGVRAGGPVQHPGV